MPTREYRLNGLRKQAHAFNGVYFDKFHEKFQARVKVNGTMHYFGNHKTAIDAANAVNNGLNGLLGKKAAKATGLLNAI